MRKYLTRLAAVMLAVMLVVSALPVFAVSAADYDQHDVEKVRAFFLTVSDSSYPNGVSINGSNYDVDDPSTWDSCKWNSAGRLTEITFSDLGWAVSGCLDLSGCTALQTVNTTDCFISGVDFTGCTSLAIVNLTGNMLTSIDVSTNSALRTLWLKENDIPSVDISANKQLASFDCSFNPISSIDLSANTKLATLRCTNCSLTSLDVSNCPLLTELNCKTNLLTELDISNLTSLTTFICFNNRIRSLDVSVMNGGKTFIIDSVGDGFVGTKCFYEDNGLRLYAAAKADEGASFIAWYSGSTQVSESSDTPCSFGSEGHLTAHFTELNPSLQLGDVNADGLVNSADALLLLRYTIGAATADMLHLEVGDVTGDGLCNSSDALRILRYAIGIIPSL